MSTTDPYRKVLLVLIDGIPETRARDAARALCERLGAGLEIVGLGGRLAPIALDELAGEFAASGLSCTARAMPDWGVADLVEWANGRSCVATVMLAAAGGPDDEQWRRLACPLVMGRAPTDR